MTTSRTCDTCSVAKSERDFPVLGSARSSTCRKCHAAADHSAWISHLTKNSTAYKRQLSPKHIARQEDLCRRVSPQHSDYWLSQPASPSGSELSSSSTPWSEDDPVWAEPPLEPDRWLP